MARPDKAAAVAELAETLRESAGAVLTEYRGLTVKQLQDLRRALGENANYAVVKNTLTQIAAREAGIEGFDDLLTGPTAVAFIRVTSSGAARTLPRTRPCHRAVSTTPRRARWLSWRPSRARCGASWPARCRVVSQAVTAQGPRPGRPPAGAAQAKVE
jgi:hypothetical protein